MEKYISLVAALEQQRHLNTTMSTATRATLPPPRPREGKHESGLCNHPCISGDWGNHPSLHGFGNVCPLHRFVLLLSFLLHGGLCGCGFFSPSTVNLKVLGSPPSHCGVWPVSSALLWWLTEWDIIAAMLGSSSAFIDSNNFSLLKRLGYRQQSNAHRKSKKKSVID